MSTNNFRDGWDLNIIPVLIVIDFTIDNLFRAFRFGPTGWSSLASSSSNDVTSWPACYEWLLTVFRIKDHGKQNAFSQ